MPSSWKVAVSLFAECLHLKSISPWEVMRGWFSLAISRIGRWILSAWNATWQQLQVEQHIGNYDVSKTSPSWDNQWSLSSLSSWHFWFCQLWDHRPQILERRREERRSWGRSIVPCIDHQPPDEPGQYIYSTLLAMEHWSNITKTIKITDYDK